MEEEYRCLVGRERNITLFFYFLFFCIFLLLIASDFIRLPVKLERKHDAISSKYICHVLSVKGKYFMTLFNTAFTSSDGAA